MSEYIKLEDAIGIIQDEIDKVEIKNVYDDIFRVGLRLAKNMLPSLPTIEVSEGCIDGYSAVEPPEDKEIVWNQDGAIIMNYETLVAIITGEIPFKVNITENRIDGTVDTELIGPW